MMVVFLAAGLVYSGAVLNARVVTLELDFGVARQIKDTPHRLARLSGNTLAKCYSCQSTRNGHCIFYPNLPDLKDSTTI
jgi:hypothetical protein